MDVEAMREAIGARVAALTAERERFVAEANQRIGEYGGRIGELERVLAVFDTPHSPTPSPTQAGRGGEVQSSERRREFKVEENPTPSPASGEGKDEPQRRRALEVEENPTPCPFPVHGEGKEEVQRHGDDSTSQLALALGEEDGGGGTLAAPVSETRAGE